MNVVKQIIDRLYITTTLMMFGITTEAGKRINCPIHGGSKPNFCISPDDKSFKCFSHDCGAGNSRDALTLYCLLKFQRPFKELSSSDKRITIQELGYITCINTNTNRPYIKPTLLDMIPNINQRKAIKRILEDTTKLDMFGDTSLYTSLIAEKIILYLSVAKSENMLPDKIIPSWEHYQEFIDYIEFRS